MLDLHVLCLRFILAHHIDCLMFHCWSTILSDTGWDSVVDHFWGKHSSVFCSLVFHSLGANNFVSVVWDGMQCSVTFSVLISGILFPGTQARCNFVSVTWDGIQCHTSDAPDSGHESGNFTATLYQELASQPGHND